ncbi:MAG: hypothetical protein P1P81_05155, partial [Desulfobulbales bacterium]|nr:hypothetical protein [Desulfobulbales bacterium]
SIINIVAALHLRRSRTLTDSGYCFKVVIAQSACDGLLKILLPSKSGFLLVRSNLEDKIDRAA